MDGGPPTQDGFPAKPPAFRCEDGTAIAFEDLAGFVRRTPQSGEIPRIGLYLHDLLLAGPVGDAWRQAVGAAPETRTRLEIDPPALRAAPWELLCRGGRFLFASEEHPWHLGPAPVGAPALADWPLRVLAVFGESPDDAATEVGKERDALLRVQGPFHGGMHFELMDRPTEVEFRELYKRFRPHLLHFSTHGVPLGTETVLKVSHPDTPWQIDGTSVLNDMQPAPRFVLLNACSTAGGSALPASGIPDLENAFLEGGCFGAISMQADVTGAAAHQFAQGFYEALAHSRAVDEAVAKGRNAIRAHDALDWVNRDWALPRLTLRCEPTALLPLGTDLFRTRLRQAGADPTLRRATVFIDRVEERQQLVLADRGPPAALDGDPVHFLRGTDGVGKTWLVQWLLRWCLWQDDHVVHLACNEIKTTGSSRTPGAPATVTALDLLEHVVEVANAHRPPLDAAPFDAFRTLVPDARRGEKREDCAQAFLRAVHAGGPRLLVFDNVQAIERSEYRDFLLDLVVRPVADGQFDGLRILVVVPDGHWNDRSLWPQGMDGRFDAMAVPDLAPGEELALAAELCSVKGTSPQHRQAFLDMLAGVPAAANYKLRAIVDTLRSLYSLWGETW